MSRGPSFATLARTALLLAVVDGAFSSVLVSVFYGSTVARLWQGVASTLLGPGALQGGARAVLIGLAMHVCVAFWWSAVFLFLVMRLDIVRRALETTTGVAAVAAIYGPCVWLAMSLVVIPLLTHRPTAFTYRWWVQLVGHMPFVGLPIVWSVARMHRVARAPVAAPAT